MSIEDSILAIYIGPIVLIQGTRFLYWLFLSDDQDHVDDMEGSNLAIVFWPAALLVLIPLVVFGAIYSGLTNFRKWRIERSR